MVILKKLLSTHSFVIIVFVFSSLIVGCSSSDSDENGTSGEFIIADVETISFESSNIPDGVTASVIGTTYIVQGFDDAANGMVLLISDFDGIGTYNLSFGQDGISSSGLFSNQSAAWSSRGGQGGTGTVTVLTNDDEETTGTFEFVGVDTNNTSSTRTITNGSFRAMY